MAINFNKATAVRLTKKAGEEIGKGALSAIGSLLIYALAIWFLAYYFVSGKAGNKDNESGTGTGTGTSAYIEQAIALRTAALSTSLAGGGAGSSNGLIHTTVM